MSLIVLLPLALALISAMSFSYYVLTRKSVAQSLCVREATKMQNELGLTLAKLMRLNPRATQLRAQRERADLNLENALSTGYPPAIAIAQAYQISVIVAQLELRSEQQVLLTEAQETRLRHERDLKSRLPSVEFGGFRFHANFWRALAVRETPMFSLSPDYVTVPPFEYLQRHTFAYEVHFQSPIWPDVIQPRELRNIKQVTQCAVSLQQKGEYRWDAKILEASALSKRQL